MPGDPIPHSIQDWLDFCRKNKNHLSTSKIFAILKLIYKADESQEKKDPARSLHLHKLAERQCCATVAYNSTAADYNYWLEKNRDFTQSCFPRNIDEKIK